jgi:Ca2+-binding RTX toxin-like protein
MGISSWTARAVVLVIGLLPLAAPPLSSAVPPQIANGALAVGGAALADPDGSGPATTLHPWGMEPAWSPDGTRLVTVRDFTSRDIWVTDLDGNTTDLQAPEAFDRLNGTAWLDNDTLVMVNGDGTIWTMKADGTGARQVHDLSDRFPPGLFTAVRLEGSRGDRLLIAHHTDVTFDELVLLDLHTHEETTLVPEGDDRYVNDAAFTADGETVTFLSGGRLHNVPASGGTATDLLPDVPVFGFDWSPDGRFVAYIPRGGAGVRVREIESGTDRLATSTYSTEVAWQPVGACTVTGTDGEDHLAGTAGNDVICAGAGDDQIVPSAGRDVVIGGPGQDRVDYSTSPEAVTYDGRWLVGRSAGRSEVLSVEAVTGSSLADVLRGTTGSDSLGGGPGDDVLHPGSWSGNVLDGGPGVDTLDLTKSPGGLPSIAFGGDLRVDLQDGSITRQPPAPEPPDTLAGVENVTSSDGAASYIRGDDSPNVLDAGNTWTFVEGRGGDDTLKGGGLASYASAPGPVTVDVPAGTSAGAAGNDTLVGDSWGVDGSDFDDEITAGWADGEGGDDVIHGTRDVSLVISGGEGDDSLDLGPLDHGADLSADDGDLVDVETMRLTRFADEVDARSPGIAPDGTTVLAGAGDDRIYLGPDPSIGVRVHGGPGDDVIADVRGDHTLFGDAGNDLILLGAGDEAAYGGPGVDVLKFVTLGSPIRVDLAAGTATGAAFGTDVVRGFDDVFGTGGADVLLGTDGPEVLRGGRGADVLRGRGGDDTLVTRDDVRDEAYGGAGRDTCVRDRYDRVFSCP